MASTFSPNLKLELIGNGDQSGTWGDTTNKNLGTLIEEAIAGIKNIPISTSDYVLTNFNGTTDEARHAVLNITGTITAARTILVPNGQTKTYVIVNSTTGGFNVNVQTWTGSGLNGTGNVATIPSGASILIYCTGSNCYTVAPYTAYTATPITFYGYASGTTLTVVTAPSSPIAIGQTIYNPGILWTTSGFPSGTTITALGTGTGGVGTYTISASSTVGSADFPQPIVGLTTLTQIATVDYVQSKMQSPYFQGQPTADTANAAAFEGAITAITGTTGVVVASKYYVPGSVPAPGYYLNTLSLGQYINGNNVKDGIFISGWGTGTAGNATFTGYISGNLLTVVSGSVSGTITSSQYLFANTASINAKITGGSGLSWTISGSPQTIGSVTNPVSFIGYGPLLNQTAASNAAIAATGLAAGGWVNVTNDSGFGVVNAVRTPMVSYSSPLQLANVLWASNISALVGTLGTQSDSNVAITGGAISGVTLSALNSDLTVPDGGTGVSSLTPNAVLTGNATSTGAVSSVLPSTNGNLLTSTAGTTVNASALVENVQYTILTLGTSVNWVAMGASAATVGVSFIKNATAFSGTGGTATTNVWTSAPPATSITLTSGAAPYYGVRAYFYIDINLVATASTALVTGQQYVIWVAGTTNWTSAGASSSSLGTIFTATGTAAGTGTAVPVKSQGFSNWQITVSQYRAQFTLSITPPDARYVISSTVGANGGQLYAAEYSRTSNTFQLQTSDDSSANNFYQMNVMVIY